MMSKHLVHKAQMVEQIFKKPCSFSFFFLPRMNLLMLNLILWSFPVGLWGSYRFLLLWRSSLREVRILGSGWRQWRPSLLTMGSNFPCSARIRRAVFESASCFGRTRQPILGCGALRAKSAVCLLVSPPLHLCDLYHSTTKNSGSTTFAASVTAALW